MKRALLYLATAFIFTSQVCAQNDVGDWFPVHVGDKWIYEHETRDDTGGGIAHLEIHKWKTEEIITASWTVPEGTLVGRQVLVTGGSPPTGWVNPSPAYLIRGDCFYSSYGEVGWDLSTHQLSPDFLKGLSLGYFSPDFCFPFVVHKTWGAPDGLPNWSVSRPEEAKDWEVVGLRAQDPSDPDRRTKFHITNISSYPGSGMTVDIWFEKGVGIVSQEEIHHGTIGEERTRLLRFEPASGR